PLFDYIVMIGKGGDLWQMGNAEHLIAFGQSLELLAHGLGSATTNTGVNLVKYEGTLRRLGVDRTSPHHRLRRSRRGGLNTFLERQHEPRQLSSGSNLLHRTHGFAGIRCNEVHNFVDARSGPLFVRLVFFYRNPETRAHS